MISTFNLTVSKNRSFHRKYVTLKQIWGAMNDILNTNTSLVCTFAAVNLSTNPKSNKQ